MGLLDYEAPGWLRNRVFKKSMTMDEKLSELNNDGREEVTEDFSDSPHGTT